MTCPPPPSLPTDETRIATDMPADYILAISRFFKLPVDVVRNIVWLAEGYVADLEMARDA